MFRYEKKICSALKKWRRPIASWVYRRCWHWNFLPCALRSCVQHSKHTLRERWLLCLLSSLCCICLPWTTSSYRYRRPTESLPLRWAYSEPVRIRVWPKVNPIELGKPSAIVFNCLARSTNSPGNTVYCYTELAVTSLAVTIRLLSPVLLRLYTKGWPGWVGLGGFVANHPSQYWRGSRLDIEWLRWCAQQR